MKINNKKRKRYLDPGTVLLIKQIFLGLSVFASVALIIFSIWHVTRLEVFTVDKVSVKGGFTIDKSLVSERVASELAGDYFRLVPKRFAYLYPEEDIKESVSQISRIKDVEVKRISQHEILVTYDEYIPEALWCKLSDVENCFLIDDQGLAFAEAPNLLGSSLVRYFSLEKEPEISTNITSPENFTKTKEFVYLVAQLGWFVTKVELDGADDVFYTFERGGEVKAALKEPVLKTIENLQTIIESDEFSHLDPGNFLYIDLRFGSRVFVNEEFEVVTEISTTTASTTEAFE